MDKQEVVTEITDKGTVTTKILKDYQGKEKPRIKISFSNGIPEGYIQSKGFEVELEGKYDAILAIMDILKNALIDFKEDKEAIA